MEGPPSRRGPPAARPAIALGRLLDGTLLLPNRLPVERGVVGPRQLLLHHRRRGSLLLRGQREAVEHVPQQQAHRRAPLLGEADLALAETLRRAGRFDECIAACDKAAGDGEPELSRLLAFVRQCAVSEDARPYTMADAPESG